MLNPASWGKSQRPLLQRFLQQVLLFFCTGISEQQGLCMRVRNESADVALTYNVKNGQRALVRGVDEWYMIFSIQTLFERETLF